MEYGRKIIILKCIILLLDGIASNTNDNVTNHNLKGFVDKTDIKILAELPLDKLLRVKYSMDDLTVDDSIPENISIINGIHGAEALALSSNVDNPNRRTKPWSSEKKKEGKVNKFFTLSITTLSFLAFGGYLLCLIVQALKTKSNVYYNSLATTAQPVMVYTGPVKKKPQIIYGRRKREIWDEDKSENMYNALIAIAEGYAAWNQIK